MTTSYRPTGLIRYHAAGTYRGYTLFSPNGGDGAYLIDIVVVQRFRPYKWKAKMSAWLVDDGGGFA